MEHKSQSLSPTSKNYTNNTKPGSNNTTSAQKPSSKPKNSTTYAISSTASISSSKSNSYSLKSPYLAHSGSIRAFFALSRPFGLNTGFFLWGHHDPPALLGATRGNPYGVQLCGVRSLFVGRIGKDWERNKRHRMSKKTCIFRISSLKA